MSRLPLRTTFGVALVLTAAAATAAAASPGAVSVRYDHPENFTETREVRAFAPYRADEGYLATLQDYLQQRAAATLQPGQTLAIVVTDVDRAGSYLPAMGPAQPIRIVMDVYPPRIMLHFRLLDAQGQVIREGERRLTDLGFLYGGGARDNDPLRYEKRTIDRWLARGTANL
jgi:hypothetical protein